MVNQRRFYLFLVKWKRWMWSKRTVGYPKPALQNYVKMLFCTFWKQFADIMGQHFSDQKLESKTYVQNLAPQNMHQRTRYVSSYIIFGFQYIFEFSLVFRDKKLVNLGSKCTSCRGFHLKKNFHFDNVPVDE